MIEFDLSDLDDISSNKEKKEKHIILDEEPEEVPPTNNPIIKEYGRDKTNNNLMRRLSNDIDINKIKDDIQKKDVSRDFVPPFANNLDDQYASFNEAFKAPALNKDKKKYN